MASAQTVLIRPPYPDEHARLSHFLPSLFLFDSSPVSFVATRGRVERIVGAASLTLKPLAIGGAGWLSMRVEELPDRAATARELMARALAAAWDAGAERVYLAHTVDEGTPADLALREGGFVVDATHDVFDVQSRPLLERVKRIHDRLRRSGMLPRDLELVSLLPAVVPKVRAFLLEHMPRTASVLALETAGYRPEHSLALFVGGEVKGVILCRRYGHVAEIGLRLVAPELQAGTGWANLLLLHASLASGIQTGLEVSRFEFNPQLHPDTQQFAGITGAQLVKKRLLFRIDRPPNWLDDSRAVSSIASQ